MEFKIEKSSMGWTHTLKIFFLDAILSTPSLNVDERRDLAGKLRIAANELDPDMEG